MAVPLALAALVLPFLLPLVLLVVLLPCCPKRLKQKSGATLIRYFLPFRYKVNVKGLSKLPRDQGILFLPNHPALMDPIILLSYLHRRFRVSPLVAEGQMAKMPWAFNIADSLPVPDFGQGTNAYSIHVLQELLKGAVQSLESGRSVVLYPAGRLMRSGSHFTELGTSATFDVISKRKGDRPWRVVLVHTHGLWGSRFSCAYTAGRTPDFFKEFKSGVCSMLASFLFFMPKRVVDITFEEVDVPFFPDKLQLNSWLMSKYNGGGDEQLLKPGEPGYVKGKGQVPYRCCKKNSLKPMVATQKQAVDTDQLDPKLVNRVIGAFAKHLGVPQESLGLDKSLAHDLGMDSIQLGELLGWLDQEFNVQDANATDLSNVASVVRLVSGKSSSTPSAGRPPPAGWEEKAGTRQGIADTLTQSQNVADAFLRNAKRMGTAVMCADDMSGVLTYDRALLGAILFADFLRSRPQYCSQNRVGVMMPAAAGVSIIVMGVLLAGCAPVMLNWTVGRASLEHVLKCTGIKAVITAKAFLKKLGPEVDLAPLLERPGLLLFTEDMKANKFGGFGTKQKIGAMLTSRKSAKQLAKIYQVLHKPSDAEAVVLFTSGSESYPKGVPLSHGNVLSNVAGVLEAAQAKKDDCLFGVLPPFHSFGFTVTTVGPAVSGLKVAYYPNPTEYRRIAREVARYKPTIFLGTPTFANGILQAAKGDRDKRMASQEQVLPKQPSHKSAAAVLPEPSSSTPWPTASLRLLVTGAEKTPDALFDFTRFVHDPPIGIIEGYGITETGPVLTANRPSRPRAGVGWTIQNTRLALLAIDKYLLKEVEVVATCSEDHKVTGPCGKEGVILAQGPGVFGGPEDDPPRAYLGIPVSEKNPFLWANGSWWYDTGDLGFFDEAGALHLAGRLKRFVKIAGEMVSLVSLEAALKQYTASDGSKPWDDCEDGPRVAVEAYEKDGEKPILGLIAAADASLESANAQLQAAGMPKIAKLTVLIDARKTFDARWAAQGTIPLLGTGKSDYAQMKRALASQITGES